MKTRINMSRIKNYFAELEMINSGRNGYTRLAFSDEEREAKKWLAEKVEQIGARISSDEAGNVIARLGEEGVPAIGFGSHLDTVIEGGLFDGALGVIAGMEIMNILSETYGEMPVPLELVCFTGEEANPLGGTFGSRAMAGMLDENGEYEQMGFNWPVLAKAKKELGYYQHFLELHIEQGGVLEAEQESIGIVTSIAGMIRFLVTIEGKAAHSGTTPMTMRQDALVEAAGIIKKVNDIGCAHGGDIVTTIGEMKVFPNMANVVPGQASMLVEIRGSDMGEMEAVEEDIYKWITANVQDVDIKPMIKKRPGAMSSNIQQKIGEVCENLHVSYRYMVSGANHDANSISRIADTGMLFVPSKDGISHHPAEYTSWEEIEIGIQVMLETVQQLIKEEAPDRKTKHFKEELR